MFRTYRNQMIALLIWIPIIIVIFKIVSDRQIASLLASVGFIVIPGYFLFLEIKNDTEGDTIYRNFLAVFLICFSIPILLVRILNWGEDFTKLTIVGIQATRLHTISGFAYLFLIAASVRQFIRELGES